MIVLGKFALVGSGFLLTTALAAAGSAPVASTVVQGTSSALEIKALVEKACSDCHKFNMVSAQRKNADQWAANVKRMMEIGTALPESEVPRVVAYLAENYGLTRAERPAN